MNKAMMTVAALTLAGAARAADAPKAAPPEYSKCSACHAKDGRGNKALVGKLKTTLADLSLVDKTTLAKKDEELIKVTLDGVKKMPAFKSKLTMEQINSLIAYVRSLPPE